MTEQWPEDNEQALNDSGVWLDESSSGLTHEPGVWVDPPAIAPDRLGAMIREQSGVTEHLGDIQGPNVGGVPQPGSAGQIYPPADPNSLYEEVTPVNPVLDPIYGEVQGATPPKDDPTQYPPDLGSAYEEVSPENPSLDSAYDQIIPTEPFGDTLNLHNALGASLFDPAAPGPTLDPSLFDPTLPGPTLDPSLFDPSATGPTLDPALLDLNSPGPTFHPNLLDPSAPGETIDPALLDPSAPGPILDPAQLEQGLVQPSGVAEPAGFTSPSLTDAPALTEPGTTGQDVQDQDFGEGF